MSFDTNWDMDKHREDHESDEHWQLRRAFMERWKNDYPEERLVCLGRVFANMEFMGCRYPAEVMQEVSRLSQDVVAGYRKSRMNKLKRTFVSASDAAEDRARGVKREGGVVKDGPPSKTAKIAFVPQGQTVEDTKEDSDSETEEKPTEASILRDPATTEQTYKTSSASTDPNEYMKEMQQVNCLDVRRFHENMFHTEYGRMVLLVRPWADKLSNIKSSCQACNVPITDQYENGCYTLMMTNKVLARAIGSSKAEAKSVVEAMAWNRLRSEVISVLVKEQWIAHGDARISVSDVSAPQYEFGAPVENNIAAKMMQMMGWKGGGLGADSQGIAEPIKPHLQMVNRAGLGSQSSDIKQLRRAAQSLMQRYIASDTLDLDLVFSSEFSKEERAQLHQCAQRAGLVSRSYGKADRFLVVRKRLDPFSLVRAVIEKGGCTPKYQVFIPASLCRSNGR